MTEFIFINPSPNMEVVAKSVQDTGRSVMRMFTKEYINMRPESMWSFINCKRSSLTDKRAFTELDSNLTNLKKPLFPSFKYKYVNKKLTEIDPFIKSGTFQDYILLTGQLWRDADVPFKINDISFGEVAAKYPSSTIITSKMPAAAGRYATTFWRTDYDVQDALGNDYFFFFDGLNRYELFCVGEELVTVGPANEKLDWLKKVNPTIARFAFEKTHSMTFHHNRNPWIKRYSANVVLLNDYSWQDASVKLPDNWVKAVRKIICEDKKKKS